MNAMYKVKLVQEGDTQTLTIPKQITLSTSYVTIRQEEEKLIIEPYPKKSLLEALSTLEPFDEDFPDIDEGLLPLDDIEF